MRLTSFNAHSLSNTLGAWAKLGSADTKSAAALAALLAVAEESLGDFEPRDVAR